MGVAACVAASFGRQTGRASVDCLFLEHVRFRGETKVLSREVSGLA